MLNMDDDEVTGDAGLGCRGVSPLMVVAMTVSTET